MIYLVDSVIHLLNNPGLRSNTWKSRGRGQQHQLQCGERNPSWCSLGLQQNSFDLSEAGSLSKCCGVTSYKQLCIEVCTKLPLFVSRYQYYFMHKI